MSSRLTGRRWLTVPEFAELTGVKPDTIRDRLERGVYAGRRVGGRWRVAASEARRFSTEARGRG
jgi:excisionase family DNA binding protein